MAKVNKQQEAKNCLEEILEIESGLSDWEVNFACDMRNKDILTPKQITKIFEIYDEHC